jgi:hypothetical protein
MWTTTCAVTRSSLAGHAMWTDRCVGGGKPPDNKPVTVERVWETFGSDAGRAPHDLHLLAAVARHLHLAEPRHLELRAALPTHEVDLERLDVLGLGGSTPGSGEKTRSDAMPMRQISAPTRIAVITSNQSGTPPR